MNSPAGAAAPRMLTYAGAIRAALASALRDDPAVFIFGEGVDDKGGIFGSTRGLAEEFGAQRCFDTPLAEGALQGIANGAALCGRRPVLVHARVEFLLLTLDQLLTHAAKWRDMFGEDHRMPVVVRAVIGRGWGQGAQHSQSLPALFMNTPGVCLAMPSTPLDAHGLLLTALESDDPTVLLEHRQLYGMEEEIPVDAGPIPFGRARHHRRGDDVTVIATSQFVHEAARAADAIAEEGVAVDLIDPRTLVPLDEECIFESVRRTGRLVVVEYGWTRCGASAEIVARCQEALPGGLRAPAVRVGLPRRATPSSHVLEHAYYPNWEDIAGAIERCLGRVGRPRDERGDEHTLEESW